MIINAWLWRFAPLIGLLLFCFTIQAQVSVSGVINSNTSVSAVGQPICADCGAGSCRDSVIVDDGSIFQSDDRALIIQMKGASVNTTNTSSGGQITSIGNAGNYEFFTIDSVAGNVIYPKYELLKDYDAAGQVQVIRIPNYGSSEVTIDDTLTAPTWDEGTGVGGVVALVAKKLVFNAPIDVIGSGFKGNQMLTNGTPDDCSIDPDDAYTLASTDSESFTKGEGIVADNTSVNRGRAPRANGGGSGISGDSGGGGGSSYGAGGIGGKRWCDVGGEVAGGLGGVSLSTYFTEDRVFLGGAGGSGYVTTNNPSDATDGGGIVILFVDTIVGNGFSILADGTSPVSVNPVGPPDGGGGGGGGGTVLLKVLDIQDSLTISVNGGNGQSLNFDPPVDDVAHGPGGGGGGGVLMYSLAALPATVTFSALGGQSGEHSDGYTNDAGDGSAGGTFSLYVPIENVNYIANVDGDDVAGECDIDDDNDGIPDIQEIYKGDHDGDGTLDFEDGDFCLDFFDGVNGWDCATDGLPNPTGDLDDDGRANFLDSDFPYCGTLTPGIDQICSNFDPDGDGQPSHLDLDTDNDGIPDIIEAGGIDTNGDGQSDDLVDSDGDGLVDIYDNDFTDGPFGSSPCSPVPGCFGPTSTTLMVVPDSDNDTIPDFLDLDADNDGIPDVVEAGGVDENGDGRVDSYGDTDGDGYTDVLDGSICSTEPFFGTYLAGSSTGITNGTRASGAVDQQYAEVYDTGDQLVLDLGLTLPVGSNYTITWRRKTSYGAGPTADMLVQESANNTTYFSNSVNPQDATQVFVPTVMTTETSTRYLRLSTLTGTNDDFDLDAVVYSITECSQGNPLLVTGPDGNADAAPDNYPTGDTDGDGLLDQIDLDADNDGIPDVVEAGGTDADGDGYADDYTDNDDDGFNDVVDGDPTNVLVLADDNPGANTSNALQLTDADANNDGRPDDVLSDDFDNDGLPNQLDLDADGDGITDVYEAGGTDADFDGLEDAYVDADNDGYNDNVDGEVCSGTTGTGTYIAGSSTGITNGTNSSGAADGTFAQVYDTGDRLVLDFGQNLNAGTTYTLTWRRKNSYAFGPTADMMVEESTSPGSGYSTHPTTPQTTSITTFITTNLTTQATTRYIRIRELTGTNDDIDFDAVSYSTYSCAGGTPTLLTGTDTDNDGAPNTYPNDDFDGDLHLDYLDIDADNDGITDNTEAQATASYDAPTGTDTDGDGIDDAYDPDNSGSYVTPVDTDGDTDTDHLDEDTDDDGFPDIIEGHDGNGNGIADATSPASTGFSGGTTDVDGDGLYDGWDNNTASTIATNTGLQPSSHPDAVNPGSDRDWREVRDTDQDGIADNIDIDDDNDGLPDIDEAQGNEPDGNEDGDEYPNWVDNVDGGNGGDGSVTSYTDSNGDGIPDIYDFDSDGIPNHLDKDADDDGITDIIEAGGVDINFDGEVDYPSAGVASSMTDADNDGLDDNRDDEDSGSGGGEVTNGTPWPEPNTDGQGLLNYLDIDADDDGIVDNTEAQATASYIAPIGSDTDNDGIDNAYDPDNGGTYITPVNTESTGNADYIDTDTDDDGEADTIEGHDTDGDGVADAGSDANTGVSGGMTDTDGDGLLDGWDNNTASRDATNNGLDANDHPDVDAGTTERDWREVPCQGGTVVLTPINATTVASAYCHDDPWTYYYNPLDPTELLFAIEHFPAGGNTNVFTASVSLTVSINPATQPGVYVEEDLVADQATFVMGRYWNLSITSGSLNGDINIRYFYDPQDADTMESAADDWNDANAGGTGFVSGRRWFMMNTGTFDPSSADLQAAGVQNATELFPAATGTIDGTTYVQFDGLTTVTGGTMAYSVGTNSVILPIELLNFEAWASSHLVSELKWTTASEHNSEKFEIERSTDGVNWVKISEKPAAGFSATVLDYFDTDNKASMGHNYYRLRMVDQDGSYEWSPVRTVIFNELGDVQSVVYPNPNDGSFKVITIGMEKDLQILITDELGKPINADLSFNSSETGIIVSGLAPGIYFVQLISEAAAVTHQVVVY